MVLLRNYGDEPSTYHWDDIFSSDGYLLDHGNLDASMAHLQIHTKYEK